MAPISEQIQEVITFREKNRGSKFFNHLSSVSESIQALGWVALVRGKGATKGRELQLPGLSVTGHRLLLSLQAAKPGPFVKEMTDAAMFYTNRVLKEYKDV